MMPENSVSKVEQRMWTAVVGLAMLFGGWWLQNQYTMTLKAQEQVNDFMRHVDATYVQKDYLNTVTSRLDRIEKKIDDIRMTPLDDKR
jgi:hypothetical protein